MGYDSDCASPDGQYEDDDEEYEETGRGNRLFGFMFGNVDNSGDLDADYLDEDAKEHLAALADKLGSSLTDIDLSVKSLQSPADPAEQEYDEKAEDAVDYEDIDEQYDGPETQAVTEEDYLLPKKDFFSAEVSAATLRHTTSVFDDENYDEEEEFETVHEVDNSAEVQTISISGEQDDYIAIVTREDKSSEDDLQVDSLETDFLAGKMTEFQEDSEVLEEPLDDRSSTPLPILCIQDGMVILRFSEIFGIQEPLKKREKMDQKYRFPRERYKSVDAFDIVEDDEEAFLKGFCQGFSVLKQSPVTEDDDILEIMDDDSELKKFGVVQWDSALPQQIDGQRFDSCLSAQPMKEDMAVDLSVAGKSPFLPEVHPLDQQDWEDGIIWDNSPAMSDDSAEACDIVRPESKALFNAELETGPGSQNIWLEPQVVPDEKEHGFFLHSSCGELESFDSSDPRSTKFPSSESRCHPQLLRLESQLELDGTNHSDVKEKAAEDIHRSDAIRRFSKITLQNRDIMEGSWLDKIIWDYQKPVARPKLILDLQDGQMLFEILDEKDAKHLQLHAGAMIVTRFLKSGTGEFSELPCHGGPSGGRFNIANDKFYSNRKTSQQSKSHPKKRTAHAVKVLHSIPAVKLQTMKPKLSNKDIANFHRPKALWYPHDNEVAVKEQGKLPTQGPMKIILKSLGGKGSKLHVDADDTISFVKMKASKKLDFKSLEAVKIFYSGKELEDYKSLAEQNVQPNSLLHLVRTKIHLLPRAQKLPGENKSLRPPGAFKKKPDLTVKDGHVFLMEYCEERPLLLGNVGMGARLCTYYQKSAPGDQTGTQLRNGNNSLGSILTLDPAERSPFLGDIKAGSSQSCLETNMYRAPIFPHKLPSTDYLLVRSAKGKLSIRRIDRIDVVGQQEPHMEVMSPGTKGLQTYIINRLLVHMYREFRALEKHGLLPCIRADELSAQFPNISEPFLRKRLKHCADFQKRSNGVLFWVMRHNFRIPLEEELRRMVTPENNRENIERLEITGVGDPSGRGLGFSYVRTAPKAPISSAVLKKKMPVGRGGSTVTGTDADLRRLSMEAAREVLLKFNVPDELIAKQTRWHRIAMIRKLSSEQAASGIKVDPTTISKYARGQRMSFLQLQQQTREKCQEIWDRQVQSLSAFDVDENESDSEANSDLDSFAGDLENLLDAEEFEEREEGNCNSKKDKIDGVRGLKMRRHQSQAQAEEEIEDEAAEAAELFRMLMDDDEADRKKKKKMKSVRDEARFFRGSESSFGFENAQRRKKSGAAVKQITGKAPANGSYTSKDNIIQAPKDEEGFFPKKKIFGKAKAIKKNDVVHTSLLHKKVKIMADGVKIVKERKSARETFVCGACGQLGHMRTNKNCPKYGEDLETQNESADLEKASGKPNPMDPSAQPPQKALIKKLIAKAATKNTLVEASEGENSGSKARILPVKFKCGSAEKPDKITPGITMSSDQLVCSEAEAGGKSTGKVNKIIISNKMKPEDVQVESHKPSIVIRPLTETDQDQPRKKLIIKRPKENINLDHVSQEGSTCPENRKTKKIIELSNFEMPRKQKSMIMAEAARKKSRQVKRWWEEEEKRRIAERHREEKARKQEEEMWMLEEERLAEIRRYEEAIRREREEEEHQKAIKKKKKKKPVVRDDYLEDYRARRSDSKLPERNRTAKRRPVLELGKYMADHGPPTKRRRGGEVGLANILERIVETLKERYEVSYLFLKPVSKKEAPDYLDIIKHPMDLSTIKEKVRRMEYKSRNEFRNDVWQIYYNAKKYNTGRNPGIPPLAEKLLYLCEDLLEECDSSLAEAEAGIESSNS
ncbi:transcription initiation factor TFIID subunit 1 isoform X2 [Malania oleifera]|uniref:transcription initiation factor TFIID subunit 1 isoform X2 n=1 Tax=Malania oleifera TaxID=397392 RepID=UPI0025AEB04F|nr:transcription initiation factor TFIID subunit 1 isoform X2 [Malania oleifera]